MRVLLLSIMLFFAIFLGCTKQEINHCALLDAERIEQMCNVSLVKMGPGNGTGCDYIDYDTSYLYSVSNLTRISSINSIGDVKSELDSISKDYVEVDLSDGAIYYKRAFTLNGTVEGYARSLYFEDNGSVYMVDIAFYRDSPEDDEVHCSSMDGLKALAEEILN